MSQAPKKPSKVEEQKVGSEYLRFPLATDILTPEPNISADAASVLKFHGSYLQDDRDLRAQLRREGKDKAYAFMVRVRVPGGKLSSAEQYLACDHLAQEYGNGTLRITTRQEFQIHGVLKPNMKAVIRRINEVLLSTKAACGDVERNVTCCPSPKADRIHAEMQEDCFAFASHFAPRSNAYSDIWLDGERLPNPLLPVPGPSLVKTPVDTEIEPIYGTAYLPRKFKTSFSFHDDNCVDVHINDLGYLAVVEEGRIVGYNVVVGGSLGTTPSADKTFPFLAVPLCYVPRGEAVLRIGESVVKAFRDLGDRVDRKQARLKYVIHRLGIDGFRAKVEEYYGSRTEDPKPIEAHEVHDHLGWQEQGDGKWSLGLPIENGRIKDEGNLRIATGLRTLFQRYNVPARLTCSQSILLVDLDPSWREEIDRIVAEHGIPTIENTSTVRRWSMACPAFPTCGLAVTEAERAMPTLMDELEEVLEDLGLESERFTVRMTGCPNGCARPYNADIGLVGRSAAKNADGTNNAGTYTIFLGGTTVGSRLNKLYKDYVPFEQIVTELSPVFERFRDERLPGEGFGDFCHRVGVVALEPDQTPAEV